MTRVENLIQIPTISARDITEIRDREETKEEVIVQIKKPQDRVKTSDHTACGQRLERIEGEMQSMRTNSECTNTTKTLTKLEGQMSQLMSMTGDIKRKIGTRIPNNTKNNPRREAKEHVKAIALRLGKVRCSLENPTPKVNIENVDDPSEKSLKAEDEP
ncbi:Retrotransposon gag protein [Gossypium australe]|uniref:Retrotransposon gag protein n=1 Tax=Gossypium australe TaxID=47621 RepID=A0A5B6WP46_9ROSI|nr:Retrotransposon gag protein [Gossypium australe]